MSPGPDGIIIAFEAAPPLQHLILQLYHSSASSLKHPATNRILKTKFSKNSEIHQKTDKSLQPSSGGCGMIAKFGVQNYSINFPDHGSAYVAPQYGHDSANKHNV